MTFSSTVMLPKDQRLLEGAGDAHAHALVGGAPIEPFVAEPHLAVRGVHSAPAMMFSIVVLPAPFGPMSARIWYSGTAKETSSSASNPPKRCVMRSTSRMAGA